MRPVFADYLNLDRDAAELVEQEASRVLRVERQLRFGVSAERQPDASRDLREVVMQAASRSSQRRL
jgi:hypothetical protein